MSYAQGAIESASLLAGPSLLSACERLLLHNCRGVTGGLTGRSHCLSTPEAIC